LLHSKRVKQPAQDADHLQLISSADIFSASPGGDRSSECLHRHLSPFAPNPLVPTKSTKNSFGISWKRWPRQQGRDIDLTAELPEAVKKACRIAAVD
jgi:hypothetical protein